MFQMQNPVSDLNHVSDTELHLTAHICTKPTLLRLTSVDCSSGGPNYAENPYKHLNINLLPHAFPQTAVQLPKNTPPTFFL